MFDMNMQGYKRPIRYGMVGGGHTGFIGHVHRMAAALDRNFMLVAGALSSDPKRAHESAADLGIAQDRSYADFNEMAARESRREDGIEAVVIVTPNDLHAQPIRAFIEAGIHVICDKPLCTTLEEAVNLHRLVSESGRVFVLTHCYTGYPMVRQARQMIADGEIGELRLVHVEYPQGWLATRLEDTGERKSAWRTDPDRSGPGGCVADIGTHAYHMARFVSQLGVDSISAQLTTFVPGRRVDDDVQAKLRFENGARGILWASQVAVGHENGLRFRIYGKSGGLEWIQADPNCLWHTQLDKPKQMLSRAGIGGNCASLRWSRVAAGHPEGYVEAFSTIYSEAAEAVRAWQNGKRPGPDVLHPGIDDGLEGMQFIDTCIRSSANCGEWTGLA